MAAKKAARKSAAKKSTGARKAGAKKSGRKTAAKKGGARKVAAKKGGARKTAAKKGGARKFGAKASKKVGRAMHEFKHGELRSGRGGKGGPVKSREQAIAIGISEARAEGDKVPKAPAKRGRRKSSS